MARTNEYHVRGYDGRTIFIPLGDRGLTPNTNPSRIPTAGLILADSVVFSDDSMRKMGGTQKIGAYTGLSGVSAVAIQDWFPSETTQYFVSLATNGNIYLSTAATPNPLNGTATPTTATGLLGGAFVTAGGEATAMSDPAQRRKLFVYTGRTPLQYYDGEDLVATTVAFPAEDWSGGNQPVAGCVHNGGHWAWGPANRPHGLYRSRLTNHAYFAAELQTATSTQFWTVNPGTGSRLYAGKSHKGMLFLFKFPLGVFWLDDSDINPGGWRLQQLTDSVGVVPSPHGALLLDDGIIFMTPNAGFYLLTATTQGGVQLSNLSTQLNLDGWLKSNVDRSQLDRIQSVWNPARKQAIFSVPSTTSSTPYLSLYFDFQDVERTGGSPRFSYTYRDSAQAMGSRRDTVSYLDVPLFADFSGNVWQLDQPFRASDIGGTPGFYAAKFQTAHTNLLSENAMNANATASDQTMPAMNKLFDFLDIEYIPATSNGNILVSAYIDGTLNETFVVELLQDGPPLGVVGAPVSGDFTLSTAGSMELGSLEPNSVSMVRHRLTGSGRRISIKVEHASASPASNVIGDDFNIVGFYLSFRDGGQDVGRSAATG